MNCANHTEAPAAAYCRTCGKGLCAGCTREVRGVIYCENCLAARLQDPVVAAAAPSGQVPAGQVVLVPSGPNPALAAILAAFFPFGVGAVYTAEYAKGLAHLIVFTVLVWGCSVARGGLDTVFGLGIAFFYFYQIIDAYRSAKAIQLGRPTPDPFGLARAFGGGQPKLSPANVPVGALVLIGLGVLFLLHTMGIVGARIGRLWPVILIVLGVRLFIRRTAGPGSSEETRHG